MDWNHATRSSVHKGGSLKVEVDSVPISLSSAILEGEMTLKIQYLCRRHWEGCCEGCQFFGFSIVGTTGFYSGKFFSQISQIPKIREENNKPNDLLREQTWAATNAQWATLYTLFWLNGDSVSNLFKMMLSTRSIKVWVVCSNVGKVIGTRTCS